MIRVNNAEIATVLIVGSLVLGANWFIRDWHQSRKLIEADDLKTGADIKVKSSESQPLASGD